MTGPSANQLGKARMQQLLAVVGAAHAQDQAPPDAVAYDWRDPHYFNAGQISRLTQVMGQVAARMGEVFGRSHKDGLDVSLATITQRFAQDLCSHMDLDESYCWTLSPEKGLPCGFASISAQTAATWVTRLLGDSDSTHDPKQALSTLEESLLSDLMTAVLEAFLDALEPQHSLKPADRLCKGQPSLQFELTHEICRIVFNVNDAGAGEASEIAFLLPCDMLTAVAGKTVTATPRTSPQELSNALMEHLQQMPVTVTAVLASTTLRFQEILDVGAGDILLLDKPIDGPAELIVDGRAAFSGRPARSQGQYAVVVTETGAGHAGQTPAAKVTK